MGKREGNIRNQGEEDKVYRKLRSNKRWSDMPNMLGLFQGETWRNHAGRHPTEREKNAEDNLARGWWLCIYPPNGEIGGRPRETETEFTMKYPVMDKHGWMVERNRKQRCTEERMQRELNMVRLRTGKGRQTQWPWTRETNLKPKVSLNSFSSVKLFSVHNALCPTPLMTLYISQSQSWNIRTTLCNFTAVHCSRLQGVGQAKLPSPGSFIRLLCGLLHSYCQPATAMQFTAIFTPPLGQGCKVHRCGLFCNNSVIFRRGRFVDYVSASWTQLRKKAC